MRLPSLKRIFTTDFSQENKDLIEKLSDLINSNLEVIYEALNNKLTLGENLSSTIKDIEVEVDVAGKPKAKTSFKLSGSGRIEGLLVLRADNLTNSNVFPDAGLHLTFTETTTDIIITHISGLPPDNLFRIRVAAIR